MLLFASQSRGPRRRRRIGERLWGLITWPFRTIDRIEGSVKQSVRRRRDRFRHKYRHSKFLAPLVELLIGILFAPFRLVWFVLSAPFRLIGKLKSKVGTVRRKRQLVHLLQGIPAALVACGVVIVLMKLTFQQTDLPREYRQRAQREFDQEKYEQARLYLQRALQLGSDTDEVSFLLALTLEETGHRQRAEAIYDSLAPDDEPGYPRAHLRKAEHLVNDPNTFHSEESEEQKGRLHRHLQFAERSLAGDSDLDYYFGLFYLKIEDYEKAVKYLERASRTRPNINYDLAILYLNRQQTAKMHEKVQLARPYFEEQISKQPMDHDVRGKLANLLFLDNDFEETSRVLQEGISLEPDGPFQRLLAEAYVNRYRMLPRNADPGVRIALLSRALELDPKCKAAFDQLLHFGDGGSTDPAAAQAAHNMLEALIAVGASAPLAHFALGIKAWQQGDAANAVFHLERAYKLDPSLANLANNLAWVIAFDNDSPDYPRALALINSVLEQHPDALAYVETRGQILVRMERWEEALDDLERVLPEYRDNILLHESLARVYENLGQAGLAEKHTNVANNLRARHSAN